MFGSLVRFFLSWPQTSRASYEEGFFIALRFLAGVLSLALYLTALCLGNRVAAHLYPTAGVVDLERLYHQLMGELVVYLAICLYAALLAWRLGKVLIFWINTVQKRHHARPSPVRLHP